MLLPCALGDEGFEFLDGFANVIEFLVSSRGFSLCDLASRLEDFIDGGELAFGGELELGVVVIE